MIDGNENNFCEIIYFLFINIYFYNVVNMILIKIIYNCNILKK
jgi:hypothetical protein